MEEQIKTETWTFNIFSAFSAVGAVGIISSLYSLVSFVYDKKFPEQNVQLRRIQVEGGTEN